MTKHSNDSRLLTVEQAAERLSVKAATIRSWILKGEKLEVVRIGRLVRIRSIGSDKREFYRAVHRRQHDTSEKGDLP